jgi:predicted alpha/beta-hydrolase family hydrolase
VHCTPFVFAQNLRIMKDIQIKLSISKEIGEVSGEIFEADEQRKFLVLAHGAGAGMKHPFMTSLSKELAERGVGSLRFNFPFIEQKKKRPDFPAVAEKTIEVAIKKAMELYPDARHFAGGKSFGGRMTSQLFARKHIDGVKGLVFFGFPLHPAGKPGIERAEHLPKVQTPMLFLQGTKDTLGDWDLIEPVCSQLPLATLKKIDRADHAFYVSGRKDVVAELASHLAEWSDRLL